MSTKSFFKLLTSLILTFGVTAMCLITAYVCTSGGSFFGYEFSPAANFTHINTMLLGLDVGGTRADVMILGQLNVADGEINMLQIPRDTYVKDNGRSDKKINSAYGHNKEKTVFKEVKQITGITVNKYVAVDTSGFRNLIDTIGGVDFDVPQDMHYEDPTQDLYIHLNKGMQHLDGDKAEQLVRFRRYPEGDIARMRVQSDFIQATVDELFSLTNVFKISDLVEDISNIVYTNFTLNELLAYAPHIFSIDRDNINTYQLVGTPQYIGGGSYVIPDYDGNYALAREHFVPGGTAEQKNAEELEEAFLSGITEYTDAGSFEPHKLFLNRFTSVEILDCSGGTVDVHELSDRLGEYGFNVLGITQTEAVRDKTVVIARKKSAFAATVAKLTGKSEYALNPNKESKSDVTIVVGKEI